MPNLDFDSRNYRAAWLWALTPHLTGTLSDDRAQSQIPFSLIGGTQTHQSTSESRNFTLDGWVGGAWHVIAGYGTSASTTTQAILPTPATISHHYQRGDSLRGKVWQFDHLPAALDTNRQHQCFARPDQLDRYPIH